MDWKSSVPEARREAEGGRRLVLIDFYSPY
jgi:hypothetical protein